MITRNRILFVAVFVVLGGAIAIASVRGEPSRKLTATFKSNTSRTVTPNELAGWIIEGRRDFAVVDMRNVTQYQSGHIRNAVNCGSCHETKEQGRKSDVFVDLSKNVVLYAQSDKEALELPKILANNPRLMRLAGGYDAWKKDVLAPVVFDGLKDVEALDAAKKHEAARAFFSGEVPTSAPPAVPAEPVRRSGPHKAAGGSEGC